MTNATHFSLMSEEFMEKEIKMTLKHTKQLPISTTKIKKGNSKFSEAPFLLFDWPTSRCGTASDGKALRKTALPYIVFWVVNMFNLYRRDFGNTTQIMNA